MFIHLTETEGGVPVCISEATSFGIAVIGTDVCGVPEIVNNQTGFLITVAFCSKGGG